MTWIPIDKSTNRHTDLVRSGKPFLAIHSKSKSFIDKPYVCRWVNYTGIALRDGPGDWIAEIPSPGLATVVYPSYYQPIPGINYEGD